MKTTHVLGHNSNWNVDAYLENDIGDYFLITAFTHGINYENNKNIAKVIDKSMIDLQFYGKTASGRISKGKLSEFPFHPANIDPQNTTNIYFPNAISESVEFQINKGFENIIIPNIYLNENVNDIVKYIQLANNIIKKKNTFDRKVYMTIPFANHIIIDEDKVEEILFHCTDKDIVFDGFFIVCENKVEARKKITTEFKILKNLSKVFKTLKNQSFKTIYGYANWDSIIYLAQTDIDYITLGTYENLRNFDIKRFVEDESGGGSKGYYFSEKLLNMVRADDITLIRGYDMIDLIKNEGNIFSDIILQDDYIWNIHKPDVNKNYLLAIDKLLKEISSITNIQDRMKYVFDLIQNAINTYDLLEDKGVFLNNESSNYHLNHWKSYLFNAMKA